MRKGRGKWLAAALALLVLGAAYTVYWRHVAAELEAGIAAWAEAERAAGRTISFSDGSIEGFPFAFRREFRDLHHIQPAADGEITVKAVSVTAGMRPWDLRTIDAETAQPVVATFAAASRPQLRMMVVAGEGRIILRPDGRLAAVRFSGRKVLLDDGAATLQGESLSASFTLPPLTPRDHRSPLIDFDLAIDNLILPTDRRLLTDGSVTQAVLAGVVLGPVPADLPPDAALAQWAREGGTVEISRFALAQAPLAIEGEGTLALDHNLQLLGALTIRARGLPETIDLLAANGMIDAGPARTGRLMAEGLAKPDDQGVKTVNVSLTLQEGYVWLGPIKLIPLPALVWE